MNPLVLLTIFIITYISTVNSATITNVRMSATTDKSRVVIDFDNKTPFEIDSASNNNRILINLPNASSKISSPDILPHEKNIKNIQLYRSSEAGLTIELVMKHPSKYTVFQLNDYDGRSDRLVVDLEGIHVFSNERSSKFVAISPSKNSIINQDGFVEKLKAPFQGAEFGVSSNVDDNQDDEPTPSGANIRLGEKLFLGVQFETEFNGENNYNLDKSDPDNLFLIEIRTSFSLAYQFNKKTLAFLSIEPNHINILEDERNRKKDNERLEIKQAYILFNDIFPDTDVKVGRQRVKDKRKWLFDEELDALTLSYNYKPFKIDMLIGENKHKDLLDDGDDDGITQYGLFAHIIEDKDNFHLLVSFL